MQKREQKDYPTEITPHYGLAATGAKRWPRWKTECEISSLLLAGNCVSLFGLRRIGKSSVLAGLEDLLREGGAVPVALSLQGAHRIEALVGKLVDACEKEKQTNLVDKIRDIYIGTTLRAPAAVRAAYRLFASGRETDESVAGAADVLSYLELALGPLGDRLREHDKRVVLILDELPFFCEDLNAQGGAQPRHITALITELRRWRDMGLTMLLSGSIGFHRLERNLGIDPNMFADFTHMQVPPLDGSEAEMMVLALAKGCRFAFWTEAHTAAVVAAPPAAYPSFFQSIFLALQLAAARNPLSVEDVAAIAVKTTDKQLENNFFPQFNRRLEYYEAAEQETAMKLFRIVAERQGRVEAKDLASIFGEEWTLPRRTKLLSALVQDDFLCKLDDKSIAFATPMVAAWWADTDALNG